MTWTWTRASCTTPEHERKRAPCHTLWCRVTCTSWLKSECHHVSSMYMCVSPWFSTSSPSTSICSSPSSPFYFPLLHFELHTELDNLIAMQNLRTSANKGSNDAYDVSVSLTGYEPKYMAFSELNDFQGSFSYITPSSDQDMDDATLGKLLTEAHRGQADYCDPEGASVSQSSLSVVFDRTGKLVGERDVDQTIGFGVTRNTYSAHSNFSQNTQAEEMVDRTGKPVERNSSNAQIRTLLDKQRQMIIAECCDKIGHHELHAAHAEEETNATRKIMATANGFSWSSSTKSYRDGGITKIPKFYLQHDGETKAHRGPEHCFGIIRKSTRNTKWSKLYERF